jgi:hypothetical protein
MRAQCTRTSTYNIIVIIIIIIIANSRRFAREIGVHLYVSSSCLPVTRTNSFVAFVRLYIRMLMRGAVGKRNENLMPSEETGEKKPYTRGMLKKKKNKTITRTRSRLPDS